MLGQLDENYVLEEEDLTRGALVVLSEKYHK